MSTDLQLDPLFSIQILSRVLHKIQQKGSSKGPGSYDKKVAAESGATSNNEPRLVSPGKLELLSRLAVLVSRGNWASGLEGFQKYADEHHRIVSFIALVKEDTTVAFLTRRSIYQTI